MYIVTTKVKIQSRTIDEVLKRFKSTNPDLIKDQDDWVKAIFTVNAENNEVVVHAYWLNKESYIEFSKSQKFLDVMAGFRGFFAAPPEVEINEILFEM